MSLNKIAVPVSLLEKLFWSFLRAFVATFAAGAAGLLAVPDWNAGKAALVALSVASLTAGLRAVQHFLIDV